MKEYTEENKDDNSGTHADLKNIELKLNNNLLLLSSSIDHLLVLEFDKFSMQGDNKAVQYRTAHLQWLLGNNAFALNSADEWQLDLHRWTPSSSARYPIRLKEPKPLTDPEAGELMSLI